MCECLFSSVCEPEDAAEPGAAAGWAAGSAGGAADSEAADGEGKGGAGAAGPGGARPADPAGRTKGRVRQAACSKTAGEGQYSEVQSRCLKLTEHQGSGQKRLL